MTAIEAQTGNGLSLLLSCPTGARSARCPQKKNRLHDGLYRQADILHGAGFAVLQYVMRQGFPDYCKNHFHRYVTWSAQADLMYRYARRWASGVGVDVFYGTYTDDVKEMEKNFLETMLIRIM